MASISLSGSNFPHSHQDFHMRFSAPAEVIEISSDDDSEDEKSQDIIYVRHTSLVHLPEVRQPDGFGRFQGVSDFVSDSDQSSASKRLKVSHPDTNMWPSIFGFEDVPVFPSDVNNLGNLPSPSVTAFEHPIERLPPESIPSSVKKDLVPLRETHSRKIDATFSPQLSPKRTRSNCERSERSGKQPCVAPYYDDIKLGVRMYRGPGFELFPVVLGSNPEHQLICDRWDRKEAKKAQSHRTQEFLQAEFGNYVEHDLIIDTDDERSDDEVEPSIRETECLAQVIEVLPDVSHRYVMEVIKSSIKRDQDMEEYPSANDIVEKILLRGQFPKQKTADIQIDGTGETIERVKGIKKTASYLSHMIVLLADEFSHVPTHYIFKLVHEKQCLYDVFLDLHKAERTYESCSPGSKPYRRSRVARIQLEKKYAVARRAQTNLDQWEQLINELQAAKQEALREQIRTEEQEERDAQEAANTQQHIQEGNVVECQCCFDDHIPANRTVSCEGTQHHQYCYECVSRLAGDRLGSMKFEMTCMSVDGCKAGLTPVELQQAIPPKVIDKLAYYQQQAEIEAAGIEGLEQCPFCEFKGICEPAEIDPVFNCQNLDCRRVTCRLCQEQAHSPKTCEQVKREKMISQARHLVEEARSQAMMRTCPKCKKKIIKESGCNKMRCQCGGLLCYACGKDITVEGYAHFQKAPTNCPQSDEFSFNRHEQETDAAERQAIQRIREEHGDFAETDLQVETGRNKSKKKSLVSRILHRPVMHDPLHFNHHREVGPTWAPPPPPPPLPTRPPHPDLLFMRQMIGDTLRFQAPFVPAPAPAPAPGRENQLPRMDYHTAATHNFVPFQAVPDARHFQPWPNTISAGPATPRNSALIPQSIVQRDADHFNPTQTQFDLTASPPPGLPPFLVRHPTAMDEYAGFGNHRQPETLNHNSISRGSGATQNPTVGSSQGGQMYYATFR